MNKNEKAQKNCNTDDFQMLQSLSEEQLTDCCGGIELTASEVEFRVANEADYRGQTPAITIRC
ncbi:MAG: hypothetical protein LBJ95_03120 [Oscillospiraceae bacterium]|jgi:hypothetical protein|nr:hypothetical protein [Oscillospiraceae bacterium]